MTDADWIHDVSDGRLTRRKNLRLFGLSMTRFVLAFFLCLIAAAAARAQSDLGAWTTTQLGQPTVKKDNGIDITGPASPASGLYFTTEPNPDQRYRLVVRGAPIKGAASLRLSVDNRPPDYDKAPNGEAEFSIGTAHRIEVLIYSDGAFEYRVGSIELQPCPTCLSKQEVILQAAAIAPGWTVDTFHQPDISASKDGLVIQAKNPPAGLFFRKKIDPATTYHLTVTGSQKNGAPTLRITTGTNSPIYAGAPNGTYNGSVSGAVSVELLIYGDQPFSYLLRSLSIGQ